MPEEAPVTSATFRVAVITGSWRLYSAAPVKRLERAAQRCLDLDGQLVGDDLVLPGLDGVVHHRHEICGQHLGSFGVCGHAGIDVAHVHTRHMNALGCELKPQRVRGRPQRSLGRAVGAGAGIPAGNRVDVHEDGPVLGGEDRCEGAGDEDGSEEVRLHVCTDVRIGHRQQARARRDRACVVDQHGHIPGSRTTA